MDTGDILETVHTSRLGHRPHMHHDRMFNVLHEVGTSGSEVAMGFVGCGGLESHGRDQGGLQTLASPMLSDPVRDRAYGTAAANDDASPLGRVPCAAALLERAGRRHALISVTVKFILLHRVLGAEPMQYLKTMFMTQSSCTEVQYRPAKIVVGVIFGCGSFTRGRWARCRRDFLFFAYCTIRGPTLVGRTRRVGCRVHRTARCTVACLDAS